MIESSLKEATMETDLPKFLIFGEAPAVSCTNSGAVLTLAENGEKIQLHIAIWAE